MYSIRLNFLRKKGILCKPPDLAPQFFFNAGCRICIYVMCMNPHFFLMFKSRLAQKKVPVQNRVHKLHIRYSENKLITQIFIYISKFIDSKYIYGYSFFVGQGSSSKTMTKFCLESPTQRKAVFRSECSYQTINLILCISVVDPRHFVRIRRSVPLTY